LEFASRSYGWVSQAQEQTTFSVSLIVRSRT
jgi:hypothetical protein